MEKAIMAGGKLWVQGDELWAFLWIIKDWRFNTKLATS